MKHFNFMKITAAVSAAAMLLSISAVFPAHAADVCNIDTSVSYQTIRGFGGINLPEWITQGDMTDAQRQKAFGNGEDELGLTVLRIYCSDDSNAWKNAVPTALYAQKMGATIFATPWNPPASMRFNGDGTIKGGKYQLDKSKSAQYAQHLNNFVKYMEGQGVNLYSISVQNEPDYAAEWTYWSPDELASFIANYGKAVTAGTKAKLMSPESFQYRKDIYNTILANPQASANVDLYGTHFYGTPRDWMDFPALENSGKEIWMTEVYVPNSEADSADRWPEAIEVSENIHNGLVVGNLNAYVWWYIRRSYGLLKENGQISKRGYCMAQYSKFVRPGDVRINATESPEKNVFVSAYKNSKNQITVVAVNKTDTGYAQQFSLSKGENITDIDRYRTTGDENLALTENLEYTGSSFWAQLPAKSVSTFIISTDGTAEPVPAETESQTEAQPDQNGYYLHDTFENGIGNWTGHGGTDVSLSGRMPYEGGDALIVQNREKTWQGAELALDSNTFKAGNTYSFSANACYLDGDNASDTFALTIQYTGADGETHYSSVARAEAPKGQWVQLANQNYTIPEGATNVVLYVETVDAVNNIYLDDIVIAKAGTVIEGAVPVWETETEATEPETTTTEETTTTTEATEPETTTTEAPQTQPTEPETTTTEAPQTQPTEPETTTTEAPQTQPTQPVEIKYGDVNQDGSINILDVITLNKAVLGKESLNDQQKANADVNLNGSPDSSDSLSILKFIVGLLKSLPEA
ncbi:MAG: carbohydrate binding domain-containing protein [Oscillospiraceae bacterium]|nr:carbohydrate binding domain-containing protein [Oscillospiraceae bacterium]